LFENFKKIIPSYIFSGLSVFDNFLESFQISLNVAFKYQEIRISEESVRVEPGVATTTTCKAPLCHANTKGVQDQKDQMKREAWV